MIDIPVQDPTGDAQLPQDVRTGRRVSSAKCLSHRFPHSGLRPAEGIGVTSPSTIPSSPIAREILFRLPLQPDSTGSGEAVHPIVSGREDPFAPCQSQTSLKCHTGMQQKALEREETGRWLGRERRAGGTERGEMRSLEFSPWCCAAGVGGGVGKSMKMSGFLNL